MEVMKNLTAWYCISWKHYLVDHARRSPWRERPPKLPSRDCHWRSKPRRSHAPLFSSLISQTGTIVPLRLFSILSQESTAGLRPIVPSRL